MHFHMLLSNHDLVERHLLCGSVTKKIAITTMADSLTQLQDCFDDVNFPSLLLRIR